MTVNQMISQIQLRLGKRTDLQAEILREIQLAQVNLERDPKIDWWFLTDIAELTAQSGQAQLALPQNYCRSLEESSPFIVIEGKAFELRRIPPHKAATFSATQSGVPCWYKMVGNNVTLYPTPDQEYLIYWPYVFHAEQMDGETVITNPWIDYGYSVLMCKAGIIMSQILRDGEALQGFTANFAIEYQAAMAESVAKADVNFSHVRGDDYGLGNS